MCPFTYELYTVEKFVDHYNFAKHQMFQFLGSVHTAVLTVHSTNEKTNIKRLTLFKKIKKDGRSSKTADLGHRLAGE
jgi:hypothetical protein